MPAWVKIDASVPRHRKFLTAGPAASWLWLASLAYCQEGMTDGFIPFEAIDHLGVKGARKLKCALVAVKLWDEVPGGWQVHDYLEHNRSAADIRHIQVERRQAGRSGGNASGHARRATDVEANPKQVASVSAEANPKQPSNPATATATEATTATATGLPIHPRRRLNVAFEGPRVYVPESVHRKFLGLRNHAGAETELQAWYLRVSDEWYDGAKKGVSPGANMLAFWDARYDEEWPPAPRQAPSGRMNPLDAWKARKAAEGRS